MTEKKSIDDDNGDCNDNFDNNYGNFDDNDAKMTKKHTYIMTFQPKRYQL